MIRVALRENAAWTEIVIDRPADNPPHVLVRSDGRIYVRLRSNSRSPRGLPAYNHVHPFAIVAID